MRVKTYDLSTRIIFVHSQTHVTIPLNIFSLSHFLLSVEVPVFRIQPFCSVPGSQVFVGYGSVSYCMKFEVSYCIRFVSSVISGGTWLLLVLTSYFGTVLFWYVLNKSKLSTAVGWSIRFLFHAECCRFGCSKMKRIYADPDSQHCSVPYDDSLVFIW